LIAGHEKRKGVVVLNTNLPGVFLSLPGQKRVSLPAALQISSKADILYIRALKEISSWLLEILMWKWAVVENVCNLQQSAFLSRGCRWLIKVRIVRWFYPF
jgi:hypothetical protein